MSYSAIDMKDKYVVLTGATSGIGKASAHILAGQGARLTMICRNAQKGEALMQDIIAATGNENLSLLVADLSVQADIRRVAEEYLATGQPIHLLLNNAGVVNTRRRVTVDGIEEMFATNHLAYFLLTHLLLPRVEESAPARIVNVSSDGHSLVKDMGFDDINADKMYKTFRIYGRSKLGNLLFTRELAARLKGKDITVNALHPGSVSTSLGIQNHKLGKLLVLLLKPFFKTPEQGAATSIYVATASELNNVSGKYFANSKQITPKPWALDDEAARRLWAVSEQMTGLA